MTYLYRMYDQHNHLLYVGVTNHIDRRMQQHAQDKPWWYQVHDIEVEVFQDRFAAEQAEINAIQSEYPRFNIKDSVLVNTVTWQAMMACETRQGVSVRIAFRSVGSCTQRAFYAMREIAKKHPGLVPMECQAGRGAHPILLGHVEISDELLSDLELFRSKRRRSAIYAVLKNVTGRSIHPNHLDQVFADGGLP